jgi:hypothetical protein
MDLLQYAREYWLRTGPVLAAIFGVLGIALTTIPPLREYTQVPLSVSVTIVILVLLFAPFVGYIRVREREDATKERLSRLEAAVFGGDTIVVPPTMRIQPRISFAAQPSNNKYVLHLIVSHLPATATEIHVEFTWPYAHIFADITDARWAESLAAREKAKRIDWRTSGLYGCSIKLLCSPTENSHLRLNVYSTETIAVRSVKALF